MMTMVYKPIMKSPEEPLELSAPLAWQIAPEMCRKDPQNGESCAWSHGFWQILRIMGLAGSAANRGEFYRHTIRTAIAGPGPSQILISGTADYAMLAQVIQAAHGCGSLPTVTVVDICETPLYLNHWYAGRLGINIETRCCDILNFDRPGQFDVVCTDAFLGRMPPALWPALAARWQTLLKPGGRLVTASRLRPGAGPEREGFSARQASDLRDAVGRAARQAGTRLPADADALDNAAVEYAARHFTYPVRSAEAVGQLLAAAGMVVEELVVATPRATGDAAASGPSFRSASGYLHVVARRP